jgi:lipoate---protein ligase
MALDSWLLMQHLQGRQPPTLRFYTWKPAAISLGYHQHHWAKHWQHVMWKGAPLTLVRRPTGGRAVLHQGDLTYAIVTSGLPASRLEAYKVICEFLIQGWRSLGVDLQYGQVGRGYIRNPNCFGTATGADLVLSDGSKLVGSAQLRRGSSALQHGSMPLCADPDLFHQVFGTSPQRPQLPLALSRDALIETVINALTVSASECFAADLQRQPLSDKEWEAVLTHDWEGSAVSS